MNFRAVGKTCVAWMMMLVLLGPVSPARADNTTSITEAQVRQAIAKIEQLAQKQIDDKNAVGLAIAVVHHDKVLYAKGFGVRVAGEAAKVDADTVFQLASLSKTVGASVLAALVGDGKITWDSKLSDLDPAFEMYDPWVTREITIRDFYSHRSGLPEHAGDLSEDMGYDRAQVLYRLRFQKPNSSFRSHYEYTNFGITEAAVAAARAYGMTWEEASEQKLYKPLGMNSTSSRYSDFISRDNKALGHVLVDGKWVQKYKREPDAQSPAGGVSSSVNDLVKWMRLELANGKFEGKEIVSQQALDETRHPIILTQFSPLTGLPGFYGLGTNVNYDEHGRLHIGHSGGFDMGASTNATMVPSEGLGIVVLGNTAPIGVPEGLVNTFFDYALSGKQTRDWLALFKQVFSNPAMTGLVEGFDYSKAPAAPGPALSNDAYVGVYTNELFGDISIVEKDGGLAMLLGPQKRVMAMKHYARDTFTYETEGENAVGRSGITFTIDGAGKSAQVVVESLNKNGQGAFKRVLVTK